MDEKTGISRRSLLRGAALVVEGDISPNGWCAMYNRK